MNSECDLVRITGIFISNFRSFAPRDKRAEGMNIDNLAAINVFVGPNGSGKTNFFNALRDCIGWGTFNAKGTCFREYDSHKGAGGPTEITIQVKTSNSSKKISLYRDSQSEKIDHSLTERIYPIGLPHKFSEFNVIHRDEIKSKPEQDRTYSKICCNWRKIREDAERIEVKLQENYPKEPVVNPNPKDYADRFFYDVVDNYGVPILEGSDGIANFLLMIVKIRIRESRSVILIEEPEGSMHPGLQKQFLDYMKYLVKEENYQFLISTHSPYLMNLAVTEETDEVSVFRMSKDVTDCTQIRPAKNNRTENWGILADLGHSAADVLQANGIIWVEGPSDLIYVNTWLEKLAPNLRRGKDYEIMWYGGSNFVHLGIEEIQSIEEKLWQNPKELIDLFSLNPNWAFLVDSDNDKLKHKFKSVRERQQTINRAKEKFIAKCEELNKYSWNVDPYIESCISGREERPKGKSKVDWAHEYQREIKAVKSHDPNCRLTDDARSEVEKLIDVLHKWY